MMRLLSIRTRLVIFVLCCVVLGFASAARFVDTERLPDTYPYLAGAGMVVFLLALLLSRSLTEPVRELDEALRSRLEQRPDGVLRLRGHDELTALSRTLNDYFVFVDDDLGALKGEAAKTADARDRLEHEADHRSADVQLLLSIAEGLYERKDIGATAAQTLQAINEHLELGWSSIAAFDEGAQLLSLVASEGLDADLSSMLCVEGAKPIRYSADVGLSGRAISGGETVVAAEGCRDKRFKLFDKQDVHYKRIRNACIVPLVIRTKVVGLLMAFNAKGSDGFNTVRVEFLERVARLLSHLFVVEEDLDGPFRDGTTGLFVKEHWCARRDREIQRADRSGANLGLVCIELQFALVLGDSVERARLLGQAGTVIRENLRLTDLAGRQGYEFYLLLPDTDSLGTMFLAGRLKDSLDAVAFEAGDGKPVFETRMGVASFPDDVDAPDELNAAVMAALEQARASGESCLVCYKRAAAVKEAS